MQMTAKAPADNFKGLPIGRRVEIRSLILGVRPEWHHGFDSGTGRRLV